MYHSVRASGELATWVRAIWRETVDAGTHSDGLHPDGSLDIVWDGSVLSVLGPRTRTVPARQLSPGAFIGVRLRPGSTRALVGEAAVLLVNRTVPMECFWGARAHNAVRRLQELTPEAAIAELRAVLVEHGRMRPPPDRVIPRVMRLAQDQQTVRQIAREVGLSERQLHRRCVDEIGYGPKQLGRILRLQRLLAFARRLPNAGLAGLALAAGYADQAHMSRDCHALTGLTPARLVRSQRLAP
jgi:AraC-like DNA-binding protein